MMHLNSGWNAFLKILPPHIAAQADQYQACAAQELRLRLDRSPILKTGTGDLLLQGRVTANDLNFCVNTATRYSPWASATAAEGFVTAAGGHRIGICGEAIGQGSAFKGLRDYRSVCIRIAADHKKIAGNIPSLPGNILIIGPPGSGKTTLLRDLIRELSKKENVGVIDQRWEIFPTGFDPGVRTDILYGCEKDKAVDMLLRTMAPDTIAMDEITRESDCEALKRAAWCGVRLIATAHAADAVELHRRSVYAPLLQCGIFSHLVLLQKDKSFRTERL
jgi:stage III sporulation protein AA